MISPDRLAELRRIAAAAIHQHHPFTPAWYRFHAEFTPGVVLELLDMIPPSEVEPVLNQYGQPVGQVATSTPPEWRRNPHCEEAWPDCWDGGYDPRCCRWPKSCSCNVVPDQDLATPTGTPQ
jgi:hypothetical protein